MIKEKLIVALDYPTAKEALTVVREIKDLVPLFKVGLQLFSHEGPSIVRAILDQKAHVFLDLKLHDIPSTAAKAAVSAACQGVFMLNLHCLGGKKMLSRACQEVSDFCLAHSLRKPIMIGVTLLTSHSERDIREIGLSRKLIEETNNLALLAKESGLDGVVASPHEIQSIKERCGQDFLVVTPGIRPLWSTRHDQERITTPAEAMRYGADYIIVGRPITEAFLRKEAVQKILEEMKKDLE